jgi:hypothetical protein
MLADTTPNALPAPVRDAVSCGLFLTKNVLDEGETGHLHALLVEIERRQVRRVVQDDMR